MLPWLLRLFIWLTPAMDRLFTESAGGRRRFLDRLTLALEPGHAHHAARYEAAMRSRNKLLAALVRLLEATLIRVGNEEYARDNESFGLTTLKTRHVRVQGDEIHFKFRGKSGKEHSVTLSDKRLARIVKRCQDLPGYDLFQYLDESGERRYCTSGDVNAYLREISGEDFTAKDFRTWAGTVAAAMALQEFTEVDDDAGRKKAVVRAIEEVAEQLGNTPSVCRACYVHPEVIDRYLDGTMIQALERRAQGVGRGAHALKAEEAAVLGLLQARLARERATMLTVLEQLPGTVAELRRALNTLHRMLSDGDRGGD